ncbi:hypothetical protein [Photobacterium sanguinicancri]
MGIGAYDAKQFIEDLGGYIEVDSTLGKGTRFQVYLPVINENQTVIEK